MDNKVERLASNIIYVQKVGDQTVSSMRDLYEQVGALAKELRAEGKPVLVLSDAGQEGQMDIRTRQLVARMGSVLDYDKSATFGANLVLETTRDLMIEATDLDAKVRNFPTREAAEQWLLS